MLHIFDGDDTLWAGYMSRPDKDFFAPIEVLPGRREKLAALLEAGHKVAIATNQASPAFAFKGQASVEEEDVWFKVHAALEALGLPLDTPVAVCFAHPASRKRDPRGRLYSDPREVRRRKPAGAMILEVMGQVLGTANYLHDQVLYIGDADGSKTDADGYPFDSDKAAAEDAGVQFIPARTFFGDDAREQAALDAAFEEVGL